MFRWRRRKQGFEWREYVRTTILVRRQQRRERLAEAGHAAVQGLKDAGLRGVAAGAEGAKAFGRGAAAAGQQGAVLGAAGARNAGQNARKFASASWQGSIAAGHYSRVGLGHAWLGLCAMGRWLRSGLIIVWAWLRAAGRGLVAGLGIVWTWLGAAAVWLFGAARSGASGSRRGLSPVFDTLRGSDITLPLLILGGVAFIAGGGRILVYGYARDAMIACMLGAVILAVLGLAQLEGLRLPWLSTLFSKLGSGLGTVGRSLPAGGQFARAAAISLGVAGVAVGGWFLVNNMPAVSLPTLPSLPSIGLASETIEGRATAVSGDALKIGGKVVQLDGIEAPERGQLCLLGKSRRWRCGAAAKSALTRIVRRKSVTCELLGTDDDGRETANCQVDDTDIGAALVENGHVFATAGFFAPYGSLEDEAREAKRGIWRGKAARPSEFRAQKWEQASQRAPEGCPIKGNVSRGRRVYVLPWSRNYDRVKINRKRGERWFCSEDEAIAAGWKPYERS